VVNAAGSIFAQDPKGSALVAKVEVSADDLVAATDRENAVKLDTERLLFCGKSPAIALAGRAK
jgi:hypothetical protein